MPRSSLVPARLLALLTLCACWINVATAAPSTDLPRIALHPTLGFFKNPCGYRPYTEEGMRVQVPTLPYEGKYVFVLVCNGPAEGIAGVQLGIDYPGVFDESGDPDDDIVVYSWVFCATLQFAETGWPAPGTGSLITWRVDTRCQQSADTGGGTFANVGFFYLSAYRSATMRVTPRPVDGRAKVADCFAREYDITDVNAGGLLGYCGFGTEPGYNPCAAAVVAVTPTTWSRIKTLATD